jgi:hypothetical protein
VSEGGREVEKWFEICVVERWFGCRVAERWFDVYGRGRGRRVQVVRR